MSRIYSATNRIKFSDIPEKYAVPRGFKSKLSEVHSSVISYVFDNYRDTKKYRQSVVDALNRLTFCIMQNCPPPFNWVSDDPLRTMPDDIDAATIESSLGGYYLTPEAIDWDVTAVSDDSAFIDDLMPSRPTVSKPVQAEVNSPATITSNYHPNVIKNKPLQAVRDLPKVEENSRRNVSITPKEDLYIQPPRCPRFDVNKIWASAFVGNDNLVIYTTLPLIPTKQNEISITTDPTSMTDSELMALYPNNVIHTRSPKLYEQYEGIDYDEDLGCIFPIEGFTKDQIVDNIIRYPHLYRLRKSGPDGAVHKFFSTIEVNGKLVPVEEIWDSLPEASIIPRDSEFVKEYVVRRYLLEEENGIGHRYKMVGSLDPFLTLFMPFSKYIERGYNDTLGIVKQCVMSRINYKRTRSPILRRIAENV